MSGHWAVWFFSNRGWIDEISSSVVVICFDYEGENKKSYCEPSHEGDKSKQVNAQIPVLHLLPQLCLFAKTKISLVNVFFICIQFTSHEYVSTTGDPSEKKTNHKWSYVKCFFLIPLQTHPTTDSAEKTFLQSLKLIFQFSLKMVNLKIPSMCCFRQTKRRPLSNIQCFVLKILIMAPFGAN